MITTGLGATLAGCSTSSNSDKTNTEVTTTVENTNTPVDDTNTDVQSESNSPNKTPSVDEIEGSWTHVMGKDSYSSLYMEDITAPSPPFDTVWERSFVDVFGFFSGSLLYNGLLYEANRGDTAGGSQTVNNMATGEFVRRLIPVIDEYGSNMLAIENNKIVSTSPPGFGSDYIGRSSVATIDGSPVWSSDDIYSVLVGNNKIYGIKSETTPTVYKSVNIDNGQTVWEADLESLVDFTPDGYTEQWISVGDAIIASAASGNSRTTICLTKRDGSLRWKRSGQTTRTACSTSGGVLMYEYVDSRGTIEFYWVSANNGTIQWRKSFNKDSMATDVRTSWGTDGDLVYGIIGNSVIGYSIGSGEKQWEVEANEEFGLSPLVITSDSVIASFTSTGDIGEQATGDSFAVNTSDGSRMHSYDNRIPFRPTESGLWCFNLDSRQGEFLIQQ